MDKNLTVNTQNTITSEMINDVYHRLPEHIQQEMATVCIEPPVQNANLVTSITSNARYNAELLEFYNKYKKIADDICSHP